MTEEAWLATADPAILLLPLPPLDHQRMLKHVAEQYVAARKRSAGERKLRLFACDCCRRHWPLLTDTGRAVVCQAEAFAEGRLARKDLASVRRTAEIPQVGVDIYHADHLARSVIEPHALPGAYLTASISYNLHMRTPRSHRESWGHLYELAALVRDIFGNPFRPVAFDPAWRTSDAVALARGIYDERAFDRMPILADALQDAGCDSDDILNHCRDTNTPHARGCWVVDLVLGKA